MATPAVPRKRFWPASRSTGASAATPDLNGNFTITPGC
jgi:hypothetical protein